MSLGVSPTAASTPTGVFIQWFEALFLPAGTLGCGVCHPVHQLLPCWPAAAFPTLLHNPPPRWVHQPPALPGVLSAWLPVSTPPIGLGECFFFISLVVGLPFSSIFCQFWLFFVFKLSWSFFGCTRRHSVSTYASILAGSLKGILQFALEKPRWLTYSYFYHYLLNQILAFYLRL